jgi:hypothetical protein
LPVAPSAADDTELVSSAPDAIAEHATKFETTIHVGTTLQGQGVTAIARPKARGVAESMTRCVMDVLPPRLNNVA